MSEKTDETQSSQTSDGNIGRHTINDLSFVELAFIEQFVKKNARILLLHCETTASIDFMLNNCQELVVVSNDASFISKAQQAYPQVGFFDMPAFELNFEDDSFDAVIFCNKGIDCVYPESKRILAFGEIWKVLKRSGVFIYSSHNRDAKVSTANSFINIILNLVTFQFLNDYWFEVWKKGVKLVWYGQIENELLTLRDLGFNIADMSDLERKKPINCYVARKR